MRNWQRSSDLFRILERGNNSNFELFFLSENVILLYKDDNMVLRYTQARHVVNIPNDCIYIHNQTTEKYKIPCDLFDTFYYCTNYKIGEKRLKTIIRGLEKKDLHEVDYKTLYRRFNYYWLFDGVESVVHRFRVINDLFDAKRFTPKVNFDEQSENYLKPYWELKKREKGSRILG